VRVNGQVFGVPFTWGPNPMIYDITAFSRPPDTWNVFWDTKYRGKISVWDDLSTVYMAAQVLGFDKPDPSQLYNLSDDQLEAVKKKLLELSLISGKCGRPAPSSRIYFRITKSWLLWAGR